MYENWFFDVADVLLSKNKMRFVDGTIPKPEVTDPMFWLWTCRNTMVKSWLLQSVEDVIAHNVQGLKTAVEDIAAKLSEDMAGVGVASLSNDSIVLIAT